MAVPAWAIAGTTDVMLNASTQGNFTAFGGGAAGLQVETDYFIEGTNCESKDAWANALKGMMHDEAGTDLAVGTDEAVMVWQIYHIPNAIDTLGMRVMVGTSTTVNWYFTVGSATSLLFETWVPWVVNFDNSLETGQNGSPSAAGTVDWVGGGVDVSTSGPSKGAPFGIDAIRYGRFELDYTAGETADYNTFTKAEAYSNANSRRYGVLEATNDGTFRIQGFHSFGTSGTAVDFRDSGQVLFIRDTPFVTAGFNRFEIINASSNVDWDNIIIKSLGTQSPGTFVHTAGTWDCNVCQFIDVGTFTLLSTTVMNDCVFRNTGIITAPGSDLRRTQVIGFEGTVNTSPVIWDVATDPTTNLTGMSFEKGSNDTHAIEFGTTSPLTMTLNDCDFSGYSASQDVNASIFHFKRTSGTITLNLVGCSSDVAFVNSYRTDGATVNIVESPVTTEITVKDINTAGAIENARVLLVASDGTGILPYNLSVTSINRSGSVATVVTGSAHGLVTDDFALIAGATENEYNGAFAVTYISTTSFSYTVPGTPSTPAGGTKTCTGGYFNTLTNASGIVTDTRSISTNQPMTGRVRYQPASGTRYKSSPISFTVDKDTGFTLLVQLIPD